MKIRVQYSAQLRTAAGRADDEVELPEGSTLADLLEHLAARFDGAKSHLIAENGRVQRSLLIVVNNSALTTDDGSNISLQSGDVITLLPPIAGG